MTGKKTKLNKKANVRREEILAAAKVIFSQKGFHATRIQDISASLNIAQGTFYLYFKNKKEIFSFIIDSCLSKFTDLFSKENPDLSADLVSFKKQLQRLGDEIFTLFIDEKELFRIVFVHSIGTDPSVDAKMLQLINQLNLFTEQYLINGIKKGFLKGSFDTHTTAKAINGMILTAIADIMRNNSSLERKQQWINSITLLIIDGLIKNISR